MTQLQVLRRIDPSLTRKAYKEWPRFNKRYNKTTGEEEDCPTEQRAYRASRAIDRLGLPRPVWYVAPMEQSN